MLLDTHVWIWAVDGGARLGAAARRRLAKAAAAGGVYVSTASVFEIVALHTAGRLQFRQPVERWIRESIDRGGLRVVDVGIDIAIDAGMVPASAIADPLDRWLVATARERDLPLVTCDRRLLEYAAATKLVRTIDGRR